MDDDSGIKVILNGTVTSLPREVGFEELTKTAFPNVVRTDMIDWEVDYESADKKGPRELRPAEVIEVTREMTINVSYTDKS